MKALVRVVAAGVFAILLTFSLFLIRSGSTSAPDYQTLSSVQGVEEKVIEIPAGSTGSEIAQILFDAGIIKSSQAYFRCLLYTSPSPRDRQKSRMPSSA